jgi:hypothetical protein
MFSKKRKVQILRKIFCGFLAEIFFCCGRPYCTNLYSPYDSIQFVESYGFGTKIEAFRARILRQISIFCSLFLGRMEQSVHPTVGTKNEVLRRSYNSTVLARKTRQISVGQISCCEVFSLVGNVVLLFFCTFLKHNNKISLSLGFPTLGFSLAFA